VEIGTSYSVASGNAITLLDINNVLNMSPSVSFPGGWYPPGTVIELTGTRLIFRGTPGGAPHTYNGNVTVNYDGGSQVLNVVINAVYNGPALPPNITIYPIVMPVNTPSSVKIIDLDYAVSPSLELVSGTIPASTYPMTSVGIIYMTGRPTVPGLYTGVVKISYSGVGSPQYKNFSITVE
jgi:hypothetical protein